MNKNKENKFKVQSLLIIILFLMATPVFAAEISLDTETKEIAVGQQFQVDILLNTENEAINAVEGKVIFPGDLLELKEIRDGATIINFWIERPDIRGENQIIFSGITPGGFLGKRGLIFTATFLAKKEGAGKIEMNKIKALLNDGHGTAAEISASPLEIVVTSQALPLPPKEERKDNEPPEPFVPEIERDPALFDGKYFLVFATQDKGVGIDRYEVKETRNKILGTWFKRQGTWIRTESPYVLQDQELRSYVFVKAVDKEGNARVVKVSPQNPLKWYENYENWIIIIVLGALLVYAAWRIVKRQGTRHREQG